MESTPANNFRISVVIFVGAIAFMFLALWAGRAYQDYRNGHPTRPTVVIPTPPPAN